MLRKLTFVVFISILLPSMILIAQGRIKGNITDAQTGEPLIGANIIVVGTTFGSATDEAGDYVINNLSAGTYQLRASFIGYQAVTISNIRVSDELTTETNFQLPPEGVTVGTVEVTAERPLINKGNTNAVRVTTGEDIEALPVRGVNNIIGLTAGVVVQDNTVFIRGGRLDEVGYYLEGVSITNPVAGGRAVTIPQDAVEEIQVQAGGYTAEFGGANAGIIRQQLKTGSRDFQFAAEYITDNIGFKSNFDYGDKRLGTYWYGYDEVVASIGGPVLDPRFRFFGLVNYIFQRDQNPQPYPGINLGTIGDPVSGDTLNLQLQAGPVFGNTNRTISYSGTFSMDFKPFLIRLSGTYSTNNFQNPYNTHRNPGIVSNLFNGNRIEELNNTDGSGSIKITHILGENMFYEINGGYFRQTLHRYDPYLEDNFLAYGDSIANAAAGFVWARDEDFAFSENSRFLRPERALLYNFAFNAPGDVVAGYQKAKRESFTTSGALSWVANKEHTLKIGGDFQYYIIRNYSWNNERVFSLAEAIYTNNQLPEGDPQKLTTEGLLINRGVNNFGYDVLGNETSEDGIFGAKHPVFASGYVQDRIEYEDLILNLGIRYDYIDTDNQKLIDPAFPEQTFDPNSGAIKPEGLVDVPSFSAISPRIGMSFPVTDKTVFHAQYGKFVQQTRLADIYQGFAATSSQLRGGLFINIPIGFDIRPTRTTQYELGFTQQIGEFASFDITGYYKDIKDQVVLQLQTTGRGGIRSDFQSYNVLRNGDFATTKGLEITFNMRRIRNVAVNASLSFQDARGTGSFPNSNRGIVGAPLDGVTIFTPQYVSPLEFNNSFSGNVNLDYRTGIDEENPNILSGFGVSLLATFNSGHPFTRGIGGEDLEGEARDRRPIEPLNTSSTPFVFQLDLKVDKTFRLLDRLNTNIYITVINLLDRDNIQNVFLRTGTTTDDGWISDPANSGKFSADYLRLYNAINIDYYQRYQNAPGLSTFPQFFGPPRQVRLGVRFEY